MKGVVLVLSQIGQVYIILYMHYSEAFKDPALPMLLCRDFSLFLTHMAGLIGSDAACIY